MSQSPTPASNNTSVQADVEDRFGVLPNFFQLTPDTPEITENLWGFARFGYLDNPLPSLFKERLFVYLSQFCEVRYCISRHVGFLLGLGRPAGDRLCPPENVEEVIRLISKPFPRGEALTPHLTCFESAELPLAKLPEPESAAEESLIACASHVFLQTYQAAECLNLLQRVLDGSTFQYLLVFLTFVRTAHFWTKVHPELKQEEDIKQLLAIHEALAECVLLGPEEAGNERTEMLLEELAELRQVREQAELLRVTLATIGDAVISTDSQGKVNFLNVTAESLTGWSNEEAAGRPLSQVFRIIQELTREEIENPAWLAMQEDKLVGQASDSILISKDGIERPIEDSAAPIKDVQGHIVGSVLIFRDITDRKRVQKSERLLASVVESSDDAIISKSLDGIIQSWNAAAERIFGYTKEQAIGSHISLLIPAERADEEEQIINRLRNGERIEHFETVRLRSDGQKLYVALTISPIKDAAGKVIGASKIARDITQRKRAEAELRHSEERVRLALEAAELGAWNINPRFNYLDADERFRIIFHGSTEPITYEEAFAAIHPEDRDRIRDAVAAAISPDNPAPYVEEYRVVHPDGSIRWVFGKGRSNFELTPQGIELVSFDGTVMDITEQRQMREDLREIAARLSEADRRKDEFLATLAHELRNPLAPIRTGLEALKLASDNPEMREEIRLMMVRQTEQMVHLIDDLLDVSRITRGKLELRLRPVKLSEVVQSAVEATQPLIDEAGHHLSVSIPDLPIYLHADPTRLAQVLSNLLNNAAKYTQQAGEIRLLAEEKDGGVSIRVIDNGLGIPEEMRDQIFEMFGQIDRSVNGEYTGLGIGLTLVKTLVEMHGGTVRVHSEGTNQGSEFSIQLPLLSEELLQNPTALPQVVESAQKSDLRILVVDDNQSAAEMMKVVIEMLGNEVRTAHDGLQAIEVAAEFQPHVVLMDLGMPKMNGYEAAQQIRTQPWGKEMILVALTGWGQEDDRKRTQQAGFDHHLVKPADPAALEKLLETYQAP